MYFLRTAKEIFVLKILTSYTTIHSCGGNKQMPKHKQKLSEFPTKSLRNFSIHHKKKNSSKDNLTHLVLVQPNRFLPLQSQFFCRMKFSISLLSPATFNWRRFICLPDANEPVWIGNRVDKFASLVLRYQGGGLMLCSVVLHWFCIMCRLKLLRNFLYWGNSLVRAQKPHRQSLFFRNGYENVLCNKLPVTRDVTLRFDVSKMHYKRSPGKDLQVQREMWDYNTLQLQAI